MNQLISINNQELEVKEFNGQRVVTFKDIDKVHERAEGTAKRNFTENKYRFVDGEDYYNVSLLDENRTLGFSIPNRGITVITEQGYLMLVKSFTDDLAWEIQRKLVNTYFKKAGKPTSAFDLLELQYAALKEVKADVESVNKDLQTFKQDLPLLGCDMDRVTTAVKAMGVKCLGGKDSNAYKDQSIRGKVYADIYDQLKRQFGVSTYKSIKRNQCDTAVQIVNHYSLPMILKEEIADCNAQEVFA